MALELNLLDQFLTTIDVECGEWSCPGASQLQCMGIPGASHWHLVVLLDQFHTTIDVACGEWSCPGAS